MIFIDVSLRDWLIRHPGLGTKLFCQCGEEAVNPRPFRTRNYAGILGGTCRCGMTAASKTTPIAQIGYANNSETSFGITG